jgi:type III secretion protein L
MSVERARVIKASARSAAAASVPPRPPSTRPEGAVARRVPRDVVEAHGEAARIVTDARARAAEILADATAKVAASAAEAAREARDREIARVAAEVLVARASVERGAERRLDRTIEVAVLLAERLIGDAIAAEPSRVAQLAADALKETRGARQVRIEACHADIAGLTSLLASLGEGVATVEASVELARGSLVVHTELGRVDARLAPQLARLADALREVLSDESIEGA